jgi:hypothetical protein
MVEGPFNGMGSKLTGSLPVDYYKSLVHYLGTERREEVIAKVIFL